MGEILGLPRVGGHPALDFANTAGWHARPDRLEHLHTYQDILDWARLVGLITPRVSSALARQAARSPRRARGALDRVVDFRETVYRIFARRAQGRAPRPADLGSLHEARLEALRASRIARTGRSFGLAWKTELTDLLRPVHPVAISAAVLLESGPLDRVRQCANDPCGWLFLDSSKSGTRRWCSSEECGNLTRVRRFRAAQ